MGYFVGPASPMAAKMHCYRVIGGKPLIQAKHWIRFPFKAMRVGDSIKVDNKDDFEPLRKAVKYMNANYTVRFDIYRHRPRHTGEPAVLECVRLY